MITEITYSFWTSVAPDALPAAEVAVSGVPVGATPTIVPTAHANCYLLTLLIDVGSGDLAQIRTTWAEAGAPKHHDYAVTVTPQHSHLIGIGSGGEIDQVSLVDRTIANDDMRGTDSAALPADITAARSAILAKLPSALVGGRIDAQVGAIATDVIDADSLAPSAAEEIAAAAKTALEGEGGILDSLLTRTQFLVQVGAAAVYWPPVGADGNTLYLDAGDDYLEASDTAIPLQVQSVANLTDAELIFGAQWRGNQISGTGRVVGLAAGYDDVWDVLVEITRTETDKPSGEYPYDLDAKLAITGNYTSVQSGQLFLKANRTVRPAT